MEILAYLGVLIFVIGGIGFLVATFKQSILWGICCILVSPVSLLFLLLHWSEAKNPFFLQLVGLAIVMFASYMGAEVRILA
jgi:hypothetical protein